MSNLLKHKQIKAVRDLNIIADQRKGQIAYLDGLFMSFQSKTIRDTIPRSTAELASIAKVARELASEIDTYLQLDRAYREGMA